MAVRSVFVSSVMSGFEAIRAAAAAGIERVGMHPVMAENQAAAAESPRRALLDEVRTADIYLLLLGDRYGEPGSTGKSATEEEYEEAVKSGRPVIVLVQEVELEAAQAEFLELIRGNWEEGILYDKFSGEGDAGLAVAAALARLESTATEDVGRAQQQAEQLARGEERSGYFTGLSARVALVPLREAVLLDALALESGGLGEGLMALARSSGLVSQGAAIDARVTSSGVELAASGEGGGVGTQIAVGVDGAVSLSAPVQGEGPFGGSLVDPERLRAIIASGAAFARSAWDQLDKGDEVGRVAVAAAIPHSQNSAYGTVSGNSMSFAHGVPATVLVSDSAGSVPRGQVGDAEQVARLTAAIRRVYADAGAVREGDR